MDFETLTSFHIGPREMGAKRPLKGVRNPNSKTILLSKAKFTQKHFFLRGDFASFINKTFPI